MEDVRTLAGKTVTVTAYVRHASAGNLPQIYLSQNFGIGGSATVTTVVLNNAAISSTWTKVQGVLTLPDISGKTVGANSFMNVNIRPPLNALGDLDMSRISIVEGDATAEPDPFCPRHIQQEMALCERYYEVFTFSSVHIGPGDGTHNFQQAIWHTQKRLAPTLSHNLSVSAGAGVSPSLGNISGFRYGRGGNNAAISGLTGSVNGDAEL